MSVRQIARPAASGEGSEVLRLVAHFRRRLGVETLLLQALRGLTAGLLLLTLSHVVAWALAKNVTLGRSLGLVAIPFVAAVGYGLIRWPSMHRAARNADRRLGLDERLGTAVELLGNSSFHQNPAPSMRLARLQVSDAARAAAGALGRWPSWRTRLGRELIAVVALACLATLAVLVLDPRATSLPSDVLLDENGNPIESSLLPDDTFSTSSGEFDALDEFDFGSDDFAGMDPATLGDEPAVVTDENGTLSRTNQMTPAQQRALEQLGKALGQVSAGRAAADSLSAGNYQAAAEQLTRLADDLDQLSRAAKDQLAQALRAAASDPTTAGSRLGERERAAASALAGSDYDQQRRALQELARELTRTANGQSPVPGPSTSMPGERRSPDGRSSGAQVAQNDRNASGQGSSSPRGLESQNVQRGSGTGAGTGRGSNTTGGGASDAIEESGTGDSAGAPGEAKERPSAQAEGAAPALGSTGEEVEVPAQLTAGGGVKAGGPTSEPVERQDAGAAAVVNGSAGPQDTGLVTPEQNVVPSTSRDIVRDYFNGEGQ